VQVAIHHSSDTQFVTQHAADLTSSPEKRRRVMRRSQTHGFKRQNASQAAQLVLYVSREVAHEIARPLHARF